MIRYKLCSDGKYRLQTVRYESEALVKQKEKERQEALERSTVNKPSATVTNLDGDQESQENNQNSEDRRISINVSLPPKFLFIIDESYTLWF